MNISSILILFTLCLFKDILFDTWPNVRIQENITLGAPYPIDLDKYPDSTRLADLKSAIEKGNNKSAQHPDSQIALQKAYDKEVSKGWMLPKNRELSCDN